MDIEEFEDEEERARRLRRRQMIEKMKKEKRRQEILLKRVFPAVVFVCLLLAGVLIGRTVRAGRDKPDPEPAKTVEQEECIEPEERAVSFTCFCNGIASFRDQFAGGFMQDEKPFWSSLMRRKPLSACCSENTKEFGEDIVSANGVLIDIGAGEIVAQRNFDTRINPASMTKIMTVLVAAELVENLDDVFTITIDITDYSFVNDCSNVGFEVGETVTVRDLFYGTILPSGADAALGLAIYVAGSEEAFVDLMNDKLAELGLAETSHFTNCVGLYDEEHYSTVYDIAVILEAAAENELCREVLSAHIYKTSATRQHPEGIEISNWFLRRIEDRDTHGEVLCAKTGYVVKSGSCAASLATDKTGREYLCVTAGSTTSWRCIYDQVAIYQQFLP